MDFLDTPQEAAFRAECRAWLEAHATPRERSAGTVLSILETGLDDPGELERARAWQAMAADEGWACVSWPREYGGRGVGLTEQIIWGHEASRFEIPDHVFRIGTMLGGPTIIVHGTPEQKARWLPPLLRGEEIWCQLFSEPGAGSDLAALSTRAERDGDEWVVNGQKVWSSGAHYSKRGMLLARTDPDVPKHKGITYFVLDMEAPGVEIRPLRQMTGGAHFNEVFLNDVRIPDADRVGDPEDGWRVSQTTLLSERGSLGEMLGELGMVEALIALAREATAGGRPGADDPLVRQELARLFTESAVLRYIGFRIVTAFSHGRLPGAEASVAKLAMAKLLSHATALGVRLGGPAALSGPDPWRTAFLAAPSLHIAGGSDQIQRNIIGERVLGLPKEPSSDDRQISFRELAARAATART